jgi:hypothetical protein
VKRCHRIRFWQTEVSHSEWETVSMSTGDPDLLGDWESWSEEVGTTESVSDDQENQGSYSESQQGSSNDAPEPRWLGFDFPVGGEMVRTYGR